MNTELKLNDLKILNSIIKRGHPTQREISRETGLSLGCVNSILKRMKQIGWLDKDGVTAAAYEVLEPYKVENAIILSSTNSVMMEPISLEKPEGLISVKGEPMVERMIEQLREAGIQEIVIVVGENIEKYLYLREKYGIKLVVNNEYNSSGMLSSIYSARDYLGRTYICRFDNYYPYNPFNRYEYRSYFCIRKAGAADELPRIGSDGMIVEIQDSLLDSPSLYGHAYADEHFSTAFRRILHRYYDRNGLRKTTLVEAFAENLKELMLHVRLLSPDELFNIDSIDDLSSLDEKYASSNRIAIFRNICEALGCDAGDIHGVRRMQQGLNNKSFKFMVGDRAYVYRHPGSNAHIDRFKEAIALREAKRLGIDDTLVAVNESEGWKISSFVTVTEEFDFLNRKHSQMLSEHLRTLHDANVVLGWPFDYWAEADKLIDLIRPVDIGSWEMLCSIRKEMQEIRRIIEDDPWQISMCHNDLYAPNMLVEGDKLYLIDWEFAGDTDIAYDVCKLFAYALPTYDEIDDWVGGYFGRKTTDAEKIHLLSCLTLQYYYWYVWAIDAEHHGSELTNYVILWYDRMRYYQQMVREAKNRI